MKRILFMLLAATTLFSSCSSDDDTINNGGGNNTPNTKKYTVNFNVKSAGFEVDKTPLRDFTSSITFLQIIVYKENGQVYSDTIINPITLNTLVPENNNYKITLQLPEGSYYLSMLNRKMTGSSSDKIDDFKIIPSNYNTDYYDRKLEGYYRNEGIYYYTSELNINANNTNNSDIVLEPMWSYIQEPVLKFAANFVSPAGADTYYTQISPQYYGFGIKSKLAKTPNPFLFKEFDHYDTGYVRNPFPLAISKAEDSSLFLDICYIKTNDGYSGGRVLKIQRINLNTKIENGMNYKISGTISPIDSIDTNLMHISLEPFKDSDITFE